MKDKLLLMRDTNGKRGLNDLINYINRFSSTKNMTMIEIGSYVGESTEIFSKNFKHVISIDPFINDYDSNDLACEYMDLDKVYNIFKEKINSLDNVTHIRKTSDEAIESINDKVGFVYIDGLHTTEQIKRDIKNYKLLIKEGYFLGGHDYTPYWQNLINGIDEMLGSPDNTFTDGSWIKKVNLSNKTNKLNDYQHKFCINLDKRTDRWEACKREFQKVGITGVERISAYDGSRINDNTLSINKGIYALALTTRDLLLRAKRENYSEIVLFEDDIYFTDNFNEKCEEYLSNIENNYNNWSILYFGVLNHQQPLDVGNNIFKLRGSTSAHAMIIKYEMYDVILDRFDTEIKTKPNDMIYVDLQKEYHTYCRLPSICVQRRSFSNIENRVVQSPYS